MQTTPKIFKPAQTEVNSAAHDQDLIEVPKRARQVRSLPALQQHYNNQEDAHRNVHNG